MTHFIPGPEGRLEAILWKPHVDPPRALAVVCHPHPEHGGTMRNNVVHRMARGLQEAGLAVLRFNFRGAGLSQGEHDGNGAEDADLVAAIDWLAGQYPGLDTWAAGFSFGARTAASVAHRYTRVARTLLVALPVLAYPCDFVSELEGPGLVLMAGDDPFGNRAALLERFPGLEDELEIQEIEATDHFFTGRLVELQERVRVWAERSLSPRTSS